MVQKKSFGTENDLIGNIVRCCMMDNKQQKTYVRDVSKRVLQ
jgi:hypothetical protein